MPKRKADSIPSLKRKKEKGRVDRAYVWLDGQRHYLGQWGSAASLTSYDQLIAIWIAHGRKLPTVRIVERRTVSELILAYIQFAKGYYRKNGKPTDEQQGIKAAVKPLNRLFGPTPIDEFSAPMLVMVQQEFVESGNSRGYVNQNVGRIRRMFKWGVKNGLVPSLIHYGLQSVDGLKRGRSKAHDNEPVRPVGMAAVSKTLSKCKPVVAAMINFQLLTGCRPGEVCVMKPGEIDTSVDEACWIYTPSTHKMAHRGREREIYIGKQAQDLIATRLKPNYLKKFVFITTSGKPFTVRNYRDRIEHACKLANVPKWNPNQLRHNAATLLREQSGLEAAGAVLGHVQLETTQIYAEVAKQKAIDAIKKYAG